MALKQLKLYILNILILLFSEINEAREITAVFANCVKDFNVACIRTFMIRLGSNLV